VSGGAVIRDGAAVERVEPASRVDDERRTATSATVGLAADRLARQFRGTWVVDDVTLSIAPGEIVGLLGPNGAGKTTTFHMILGLLRPQRGRVHLDGRDITRLPMYMRARRGVGYLPQEASIFRRMTVEENLLAVLELGQAGGAGIRQRAEALLHEFGLTRVASTQGFALSGGERRRAEIARALASEPRYMMLDEPFAGIDPIAVSELQHLVVRLRDKGIGVLMTDHNVRETLQITDRAYIISAGRIFRHGTPSELAADAEVRRVYLGEHFRLN
jgi:lipopolysaccharide export system ATP-binding protein